MTDEMPPPSRSELIRTAILEIGIGFVAVIVVIIIGIVKKGGRGPFQAKPFTPEFLQEMGAVALLILVGATLLAIRDYRAGMKKWKAWEYRKLWGCDPDSNYINPLKHNN